MKNILTFSKGILKITYLPLFLPEYHIQASSCLPWKNKKADQVLGWGLRPSTRKARAYAKKHKLSYVALEDGFLRSLGLGVQGYPPLSIVVDNVGIYYDTTRPSLLEQLILETELTEEQENEAIRTISLIREHRLSKYNHAPELTDIPKCSIVLVIDQTFGDMAVKYGQADASHFEQMLNSAISENPQAEIWVKTHPDVISGKKQGYLTKLVQNAPNVRLFSQDVSPLSLLNMAAKVYCVTSQMGFEALLLNKQVITFGIPWFAGWGLTDDRHINAIPLCQSSRRKVRSILALFYAAYFRYSRYINPHTGKAGTIFDVIDYLIEAKRHDTYLKGDLYCVGMSLWKQAVIKPFFRFPNCRLHFVSNLTKLQHLLANQAITSAKLLVWSEGKEKLTEFATRHQLPILRMEDGFIRSVGLGSNLVSPLSLVVDELGIYFNAQKPSRLENILQNKAFSSQDLERAEQLRQVLIQSHIAKYNVGSSDFSVQSNGLIVLLVVGQVEDDASIRFGSPQITDNFTLLKTVRERNPNAYIIYKPHPDVVSGNRKGNIPEYQAHQFADRIATTANILDCINQADEIHTMTSLAGFEALLRNKTVHCYGLPFYSGWGLTVDYLTIPRRSRKLSLHELIAATLIYYPLYFDPNQQRLVNVEQAVCYLKQLKATQGNANIHRTWFEKQCGKLKQLWIALR
ncbi:MULTISPECIES: capsular polysaccharide biosynthesis protein [unclassified Pasteurella]|uniref:capsular polysaccharide biosynthesis protein n=1 Tax=unclassified Pasteurella TaxID=2621516 RepID=UPI0010739410|nr:capsular polysaccharide biosynthesis protein [Pasteurella sp. 19428wF3_WM03]TFU49975.1 capsular polysaccharide biosynthesis protein [Pasteurella sp. WM03]